MPCFFFLGYALVLSPLLKVTRDFLESGEPECQSRKMWGFISSLFFVWHISQASSLILPSQLLSFSLVQVYYYREREYPLTCPHCLFGHIWFISSVALIQNVESFNHWRFWRILSRKVQPTFTNHLLVIGGICRWLGGDLPTF